MTAMYFAAMKEAADSLYGCLWEACFVAVVAATG